MERHTDTSRSGEPVPEGALERLERDPSSRKRFLSIVGGAGAVGAFSTLIAACGGSEQPQGGGQQGGGQQQGQQQMQQMESQFGKGDLGILNYALTLEFLEAEFYAQAIKSGKITDQKVAALAKSIGQNEQDHVEALTQTIKKLGGTPAQKPKTNFQEVINGGPEMILNTAATVENVGAAAYLGQAGNIQSDEVLAAALSIHTVEAEHAAALNELVGRSFKGSGQFEGSVPDGAFAKPADMQTVLKQIQPFLAS